MPIAATSHSVAAVVSPRTERPCRMIAPAPRKPMPLTICAAMRVGSMRVPVAVKKSSKPYADTSVKSADPTQTTRCVRSPACRSRSSRSNPIAPPRPAEIASRSSTCGQASVGAALRKSDSGRLHLPFADGGAARAAVGLEHVAVEPHRPLPERAEVGDRAHRAADQPLDLDRAPLLLAARGLSIDAVARRGRQQRVLRGDPAPPLVAQPPRYLLLDHRRAEDDRLALGDERRPVRLLEIVRLELELAQLVRLSPVGPHAAAPSWASVTCSTSPIGSWRKRRPISRNAVGSPVVRKR